MPGDETALYQALATGALASAALDVWCAGFGAIVLLPWLQSIILMQGWRASCSAVGLLVLLVITPLSLLVPMRPAANGSRSS